MEGQRDLHATIDTHYIPYPPTIYTTLAGYGIAERDGERRESGRRACLRIGTACVLRIGTTSDTVRARTASERLGRRSICGAATIGACERCGSEPCASVTERALRALLDEFTAAVQALGATGGDADLYGRLRVRLEA